jgi:hypothetical protein
MALRPARGHNHGVGDRGFAGKIDGDGILGLHVIEAGEDQAKNLLGGRTQLGDRFGGPSSTRPSECRCWQGSFPFGASTSPREAGAKIKIGTATQWFQLVVVPQFPPVAVWHRFLSPI